MDRPLRIGLLTHSVNPRGGVMHVLELARALHAAGHAVTVFAPAAPGQRLFRTVPHAVSLAPLPPERPGAPLEARVAARIAAYRDHLRQRRAGAAFDVLHAHDGIGANALADLGLPFLRTVHHLDPFDDNPQLAAWQDRSVRAAAGLLCVSELWRGHLAQVHGRASERVHNGVDLHRFHPRAQPADAELAAQLGLRPGAPLWLSVGGVEARKNTRAALEAFAQHRRARPDAQWVIAGGASLLDHDAYRRDFDRRRTALGLGDADAPGALVLTGPLPDDTMPALFRLADGLLMPSLREGFGLVVLEAMASGTPVVVSRQAPFTEYLADEEAGWVHWADPAEPTSIAAAMDAAVAAPLPAGTPAVCLRHGWAASAARHVALYRRHADLLADRRATGAPAALA